VIVEAVTLADRVGDLLRHVRKRLTVLPMARVNRAFNQARNDLRDLGLIEDGRYLDRVDCYRVPLPSLTGEMGYVFDGSLPWVVRLADLRSGVIYLPLNPPVTAMPGDTLVDVVRHEFGHAWAWLDRPYLERRWFRDAFGARYGEEWEQPPEYDPAEYVST
jgi:hypothetical protein